MANDGDGGLPAGGGNRSLEELRISQTILGRKLDSISNDLRRASDTLRVVTENLRIRENRAPPVRRAYVSSMGARGQRRARRHAQPAPPEFSESDEGGIPNRRPYDEDSSSDEEVEQWILGEPRFAAQPRYLHHLQPPPPSHRYHHSHPPPSSSSSRHHIQTMNQIPIDLYSLQPTKTQIQTPSQPSSSHHHTQSHHNSVTKYKPPNHRFTYTHEIEIDSPHNRYTLSRFDNTHRPNVQGMVLELGDLGNLTDKAEEGRTQQRTHETNESVVAQNGNFSDSNVEGVILEKTLLGNSSEMANNGSLIGDDVFCDKLGDRVANWNAMIDGYLKCEDIDYTHELFSSMTERNVGSYNTMISGFAKFGRFEEARNLFDEMSIDRDELTWSAIIDGYIKGGFYKEALEIFNQMQREQIRPKKFVLSSVLSACANVGALDQGKWIHAYVKRNSIFVDAVLGTALVDMYAICGRLDMAWEVFENMKVKEVFSWNAMIGGLAIHGRAEDAIELFLKMQLEGISMRPNFITFVSVLTTCSHAGLVLEGWHWFKTRTGDASSVVCQIVSTMGIGFENFKSKGVRRRQWQIAWSLSAFRWTIVLVPLWISDELRRDFSVGVYHSHKPNMGLRSFVVLLVPFPHASTELEVEFFSKKGRLM